MKNYTLWEYINRIAPFETAEEWDNVGLLVGGPDDQVNGVLVALDVTPGAIAAAKAVNANLILTHHPLIFEPLRQLDSDTLPYQLAASHISVLSAHTNLDKAVGGVNDALAEQLGLHDVRIAPDGMSRIGSLAAETDLADFTRQVATCLDIPVHVSGQGMVRTVAVCGGSGGDFIPALASLADVFVTGEIRHHQWLSSSGMALIEAGHYATEAPVIDALCRRLREAFPTLSITPYYDGVPYTTIK